MPKTSEELIKELQNAVHDSALKGNSQAQRLEAQLIGLLNDKSVKENRFEFTPAQYVELTNRIIAGLRDAYQECGGVCPICGQSQLFPKTLRLHSEQERGAGSEMDTVAVPDGFVRNSVRNP